MSFNKTILCIDDDKDNCELVTFVFQNVGFEVISCHMPEEGIRYARTNKYAAIITDFYLNGMDGTDLSRVIRTFDRITPIIFFTGEARAEKKQLALEAGAQAYITKPTDFGKFEQTVIELINENTNL